MRFLILSVFTLLFSLKAFAGSDYEYSCTLKTKSGEYKFVFDDSRYGKNQGLVEVYENKKIISTYVVTRKIDPDTHGDSWSFTLTDAKTGANSFELYLYAQYLQSAYVTVPSLGLAKVRVEDCSPKLRH